MVLVISETISVKNAVIRIICRNVMCETLKAQNNHFTCKNLSYAIHVYQDNFPVII